ncbi:hypothetical protein ES703_45155 [subsurface metagenome]
MKALSPEVKRMVEQLIKFLVEEDAIPIERLIRGE